jgi:hypothetical protein
MTPYCLRCGHHVTMILHCTSYAAGACPQSGHKHAVCQVCSIGFTFDPMLLEHVVLDIVPLD